MLHSHFWDTFEAAGPRSQHKHLCISIEACAAATEGHCPILFLIEIIEIIKMLVSICPVVPDLVNLFIIRGSSASRLWVQQK